MSQPVGSMVSVWLGAGMRAPVARFLLASLAIMLALTDSTCHGQQTNPPQTILQCPSYPPVIGLAPEAQNWINNYQPAPTIAPPSSQGAGSSCKLKVCWVLTTSPPLPPGWPGCGLPLWDVIEGTPV